MKILVIDDSKVVRYITIGMLKELGYENNIVADNYDSAITLMRKTKPDLILSDMNMPGKSGLDILRYVRSTPELSKIPFVLLSTFQDRDVIVQAINDGAQHYLKKPLDQNKLKEKMTALSSSYGFKPPV